MICFNDVQVFGRAVYCVFGQLSFTLERLLDSGYAARISHRSSNMKSNRSDVFVDCSEQVLPPAIAPLTDDPNPPEVLEKFGFRKHRFSRVITTLESL